ncbi:uncharacterized protein LOC127242645 [Andrographis paniculata]|uniref:uncharacterized protein LOC127242645 n=1 Tax=Andrographis paniculata TaxID=175694 RepID=UPI0021E7061A|nr:uncharacterized protein LOC127242645 [Andrographis paniculata]
MAENDTVLLRALELRLLRCSLPAEHPPPIGEALTLDSLSLPSLVSDVVALIESGCYVEAVASSAASRALFRDLRLDSVSSAEFFYREILPECVRSFLDVNSGQDSGELRYKALLVMAVGVAALLAFTQCNFTGPSDNLPLMPLVNLLTQKYGIGGVDWIEWEAWALKELTSVGSDLLGKFKNLQYLVFAKTLLERTKDVLFEGNLSSIYGVRSIWWWLVRALFLHQKLLDERSSPLFDLLQVYAHESLFHLGTLEKIKDYWCVGEGCSTILSILRLEVEILELYYGRVDASKLHIQSAAEVSSSNFFVSGALGFRTVHQVEPKAQLQLVSETATGRPSIPVSSNSGINDTSPLLQQHSEMNEASDVLMTPRFIEDETQSKCVGQDVQYQAAANSQLKGSQQAVILAHCLLIERIARNDELQKWEMAPYIEAIDSQKISPFILRCFSSILRVRWESSRGRTKQRALLMMDHLVESIRSSSPGVPERLHYFFAVNMPSIPALRKEYGDLLVSCGLVGEALKIYEDLELWDNLIHCYQLMDKKTAAVDLIKKRLLEKPFDSRLWCSLGDVTDDDTAYEKALDVSGRRSARAFRSLARSLYNRGDYDKSKTLWESAMSLNSLYPDGWFALGAAALKSRDVDKALDAFTRAVQLDPENGEAWNNIACLHMIKNRSKESFIAFKEALKLKRDSWQMWENYSRVAADIGNFTQAIEAIQKVLDMTKRKRVDSELLERIMVEVEGRANTDVESNIASNSGTLYDSTRNRETDHLMELVGKILKQIVQSGGSPPDTWGLYARWHKLKGDLAMCSEALLKQVRAYQGSDLWKDRERFVRFARASLELCKVYQEVARRGNTRKELFAAEMLLKNNIKQATDIWSDTKEYRDLVACLENVEGALHSTT